MFHFDQAEHEIMSQDESPRVGEIGWTDLTVPSAPTVRDFYVGVVGWKTQDVQMGDYSDYVMTAPASGQGVAGVCHARGVNADRTISLTVSAKKSAWVFLRISARTRVPSASM